MNDNNKLPDGFQEPDSDMRKYIDEMSLDAVNNVTIGVASTSQQLADGGHDVARRIITLLAESDTSPLETLIGLYEATQSVTLCHAKNMGFENFKKMQAAGNMVGLARKTGMVEYGVQVRDITKPQPQKSASEFGSQMNALLDGLKTTDELKPE